MITYKKTIKEVEEVFSMRCDKCGNEYDSNDLEAQEFCHIKFRGGYTSVFGDGTDVECDICQHCLHEIIGDFCRRKEAT
jgi:hypothetical protein